MLFEENDFDINMSIFVPDVNFNRSDKFLDPMEGFLRGNMFKDEYKPYKNLSYFKLNATSEREKLLYKVMSLSFVINDLNLYLDVNPNNSEAFMLFKKYIMEYEKLSKEYENKYGPLKITDTTGTKYNWIEAPWPWDTKGGSMYV